MIDTVSITLPEKTFRILNHNRFSPCTENLYSPPYIKVTGRAPFKAVNNPTKADVTHHGYLPRLTLFKVLRRGGFSIFLKVELSIPKLLHGNNFDEVQESDFGQICWQLQASLRKMDVIVDDVKVFANADVSTIHYSKNIILTDYSTPYTYLEEVRKLNVSKILDVNQSDYRNEGHAIRYRSSDFEVVFYDKLKDLKQAKKSDKRAVEKDSHVQLGLFDEYKPKSPFEVLRIEARIGSRKKLEQLLKKYKLEGRRKNFNDLFSKEVSQTILLSIIDDMEKMYPALVKSESDTLKDFAMELLVNNPNLSHAQVLKYLGAKALIQEVGVRDFRTVMDKWDKTLWYRLNKSMSELKLGKTSNVFKTVRDAIVSFSKIELEKYKSSM